MRAWITLAVFIYVMIGCFHVGLFDLKFDDDGRLFLLTIFLWPVVWAVLAVIHVFLIPIRLGRKLGDKICPSIDDYISKLFSNE